MVECSEEEKAAYEAEQTARVMQRQERLAHARAATRETLTSHLTQTGLPPFVHDFLNGHWRELLIAHYVNDETGEKFADAATLTQELVWSLLPQPQLDWRKQLLKSLSGLVEALRAQLQTFPLPGAEEQRFFDALSALHLELIRSGKAPDPVAKPETDNEPQTRDEAPSDEPTIEPSAVASYVNDETASANALPATKDDGEALAARLAQAIEEANRRVYAKAEARPECQGMGTTVVAACFERQWLTMAHVGDSRLYRRREDRLEQLTRDHSLREDLVARGFYTPEEAVEKVPGNYVTRAVGGDAEVEVATDRVFTLEGDVFLLCSDGLSDLLDDNDINTILGNEAELEAHAQALIDDDADTTCVDTPGTDGANSMSELAALAAEYGEVEEIVLDSNVADFKSNNVRQTIVAEPFVDEFLQAARGIAVGTWVLFKKADGDELRGRLSWKSDVSDKLLFTDRSGIKVADPTVHGFAIELRRGTASIIDDVPLFDRAMSSLTQRLRGHGAKEHT